jgi:hypothetical protein
MAGNVHIGTNSHDLILEKELFNFNMLSFGDLPFTVITNKASFFQPTD